MAFGVGGSASIGMPPPKKLGVSSLPNAGDRWMDVCCDLQMTNSIAGRNMCAKSIFTWLFLQTIWHERAHAHMHTNTPTNYSKRSVGKSVLTNVVPKKIYSNFSFFFRFFRCSILLQFLPIIYSIHLDSNGMSTGKLKMNELLGDDYFKPISYS